MCLDCSIIKQYNQLQLINNSRQIIINAFTLQVISTSWSYDIYILTTYQRAHYNGSFPISLLHKQKEIVFRIQFRLLIVNPFNFSIEFLYFILFIFCNYYGKTKLCINSPDEIGKKPISYFDIHICVRQKENGCRRSLRTC